MSEIAAALTGVQEAVEAYDAMRDRPTDERVAEFKEKMEAMRSLAGLGTDPVEPLAATISRGTGT